MVTHNIEEAVSMGDRIVVMEKDPGRVISEVLVKLAHPRHRKSPEFQTLVDQVYFSQSLSMLRGTRVAL